MLASGTAEAVLGPAVQGLLDVAIRRASIEEGVGYYAMEDVRAHVQEAALRAATRFDPARGTKLTTFLWKPVLGAALELIRSKGPKTRLGLERPAMISLEREQRRVDEEDGWSGPAGKDGRTLAGDGQLDRSENQADVLLALTRLPARLRLVLYLLYYEGLTPEIAARRLRCSPEGLRQLRDASLQKVRLALLGGS